MHEQATRFLKILRSREGVAEEAQDILVKYWNSEIHRMSKDKSKGSSETDEPWKVPGESSQQPEQKGPPKRNVERDYGGKKAETT
jgi:hypothetical protein